jgi:hypothetical protein
MVFRDLGFASFEVSPKVARLSRFDHGRIGHDVGVLRSGGHVDRYGGTARGLDQVISNADIETCGIVSDDLRTREPRHVCWEGHS